MTLQLHLNPGPYVYGSMAAFLVFLLLSSWFVLALVLKVEMKKAVEGADGVREPLELLLLANGWLPLVT